MCEYADLPAGRQVCGCANEKNQNCFSQPFIRWFVARGVAMKSIDAEI
jgi:hypothetical protein